MNNYFTLVIAFLFALLTAPLGFSQSNTITKTMLFSEIQDKFVEGADAHKIGDFTLAYDNLSFAAQSGMKEAQYLLGFMYLKGEYVERSIPVGMAWLGTALEIENKDWATLYSRVYDSLNEQQQIFIDRKVRQYIDIYGMDIQNVDCQLTSVIGSRKRAQRCTKQADRLTPLFSMEDIPKDHSPEFNCESTFPCLIGNLRIYDGVESHNGALPFQF